MILAAGRGERMRPLTDHTPKPLLNAGGKPLIVWHIERLVRAGITEIIINHAHLGEMIENVLGAGNQFGAQIRYSAEGTALETAGGIAFALDLLGEDPFIVVNGDIYCDYNIVQLCVIAEQLKNKQDIAHLVLVNNPSHHQQGDFLLEGGRVLPTSDQTSIVNSAQLTFSGIGLYKPTMFSSISRGSKVPLAPLLRQQISLSRVSGEHYQGLWIDVGTPERLDQLDKNLRTTQNAIHV
jgi:MurNAc alpha-1-phosphate uridylyltransferase